MSEKDEQNSSSFPSSSLSNVSSAREKGREEKERSTCRGRDRQGYALSLSFWVPGSQRSLETLFWPYIVRFKGSWQFNRAGGLSRVSRSRPEVVYTLKEPSPVASWHAFRIAAVVLIQRWGQRGRRKRVCIWFCSCSWMEVWPDRMRR